MVPRKAQGGPTGPQIWHIAALPFPIAELEVLPGQTVQDGHSWGLHADAVTHRFRTMAELKCLMKMLRLIIQLSTSSLYSLSMSI